mmetsp:Transcript_67796/g.187993  ORF Transcript_67796/g.187993 Transcript_67796/m.187993 type:complete len:331 (+) Transcript_67796:579-1571(+)
MPQQQDDEIQVATPSCVVEWCVGLGVPATGGWQRAGLEQQLRHALVAAHGSEGQGGPAVGVGLVHVRAVLQQHLHRAQVSVERRVAQRGHTWSIGDVLHQDVRSALQAATGLGKLDQSPDLMLDHGADVVDVVVAVQDEPQRFQVADVDDGVAAEAVAPAVDSEPRIGAHLLRVLLQEELQCLGLSPYAAADPRLGAQGLAHIRGLGCAPHDGADVLAMPARAGVVQCVEPARGLLAARVSCVLHQQVQHLRVVAQGAQALQDRAAPQLQPPAQPRGCQGRVHVSPSPQHLHRQVPAAEVRREAQRRPAAVGLARHVGGHKVHPNQPLLQ